MRSAALAFSLVIVFPQDDAARLLEVRREMRQLQVDAAALLRAAHDELDLGHYEASTQNHRKSQLLGRQHHSLAASESELTGKIALGLLKDLDADTVEARERASRLLVALGPTAIPFLEKLAPGPSAEVQLRLAEAIAKLKRMEVDPDGRLHQWARSAQASSEYSATDWSAMQATGKPDTEAAGDKRTAWASREADSGDEWLELGYEHAVRPSQVRVHETFNPGAVIRLEAVDEAGKWQLLWEGKDRTKEPIRWFKIDVTASFATRLIRLTLDSAGVLGWNEIDAVELIGDPAPAIRSTK
jgi:hypothetical protein